MKAEPAQIVTDWARVTVVWDVPVPDELGDRAADSWGVHVGIAAVADPSWLDCACRAAVLLQSESDEVVPVEVRLPGNVREVFEGADHLWTEELLRRLHEVDGAPWSDGYGGPLSAQRRPTPARGAKDTVPAATDPHRAA
jgi:hypothetical protein